MKKEKNALLKPFEEFMVLGDMSHPFSLWPCNKRFSAQNSHVLVLFGLSVHQARELVFGNRTTQ